MASPKKKTLQADVLIVGGGLSGLTLAAVLGQAGVDVVVVDKDAPPAQMTERYDGRTTAISYASHKVLQAAGVWDAMAKDGEPILDIRVADGNSSFFLHFSAAEDSRGAPFGWIIENRLLRKFLFEHVKRLKKTVRHLAPVRVKEFFSNDFCAGVLLEDGTKITAPLLVGADGRGSSVRQWLGIDVKEWEYRQTAIVCNVAHDKDHENVAVEHFLPAGPFAALPMTKGGGGEYRSSVVWSVHGHDAKDIMALPAADFDRALQKLFGPHLGAVRHVSKPMGYPLRLMHAKSYIGKRTALMAEAAHVIHPIAGQGLNLSMRDIAVLGELVVDHLKLGLDIGAAALLKDYEQLRRTDILMMAAFTEGLNRLFSNNATSATIVRDIGLGIVEKIPPLKGFFAHQAMGLGGRQPRILREGRL